MDYRKQLIALVQKFSASRGLSEARIANLARCDSRFFVRLREGGGCRVDTLVRVTQFFSDNWPSECEWPAGVKRPEKTKSSEAA